MFNNFVKNCQQLYSLGSCATIDEMLVSFRGRCKFRVYMPNKPCKYGIKIMAITDAKTHYFLNGYIYVGKDSDGQTISMEEQNFSKPTQSVIRLSKPIYKTNRNITADNWFTSLELVRELKANGLTYVGTIRKNKKDIPKEFQPNKNRAVQSTLYGFTDEISLVSYVPKKNKAVMLVSSMHHTKCTDLQTKKPEVIIYYNSTKGGVDALDEKCATYCTGRRTRRWPLAIFYRILDISGVNAYVLYNECKNNPKMERSNFLKSLAKELVTPEMKRRLDNTHTKQEIKIMIRRILKIQVEVEVNPTLKLEKRKNCYICPYQKSRKASHACVSCKNPVCSQCSQLICKNCAN